jgi:hypothetical protein
MAQGHEQSSEEQTWHDASSPTVNAQDSSPTPPATSAALAPPGDRRESDAPGTRTSHAASAPSWKGHVLTAVLALIFGMIGAYVYLHFLEKPTHSADTTLADPAAEEKEAGPSTVDLESQIGKLVERVDGVNRRLDTLPKPESPPDLSDLQVQVANIAEVAEGVAPLRKTVEGFDHRLDDMSQALRSLGDQVHAIQSRAGTLRTTSVGAERPASTERSEAVAAVPPKPVDHEALEQGAALFNEHKFKDALEIFTKLEQTNPDDARVWYYAALAHGFSTNQWTNGTAHLAEKGIERERAGTPPKVVIDATFKDLTSAMGKDWLSAYRQRVQNR